MKEPTKVVDKANVISFHYDARGNEHTPRDSLGIQLDTLEQGHALLPLRCQLGALDDAVGRCEAGDAVP